jgi:hypothetical protein
MVPQVAGRTPPSMQVLRHPTSPTARRCAASRSASSFPSRGLAQDHPVQLGHAVGGQVVMVASLGRLLAATASASC